MRALYHEIMDMSASAAAILILASALIGIALIFGLIEALGKRGEK